MLISVSCSRTFYLSTCSSDFVVVCVFVLHVKITYLAGPTCQLLHDTTAAESNGKLKEFILWYKKNKSRDAPSKHGLELGKSGKANVQSRTVPLQFCKLMA